MSADGVMGKADETSMFVWASLEALKQAATTISGTPTKASTMQAMYGLKNFDAGGLIPPISFTAGQPSPPVTCYFVAGYQNGQFTLPNGPGMKCLSS